MRHRRRCQGPKATNLRRKACDVCVRAKARCCYSQPTCSRCVKLGKICVYSTPPAFSVARSIQEDGWSTAELPNVDPQISALESNAPMDPDQNPDLDVSNWGISESPWQFDAADLVLAFDPSLPAIDHRSPAVDQSFMHAILSQTQLPHTSSRSPNSRVCPRSFVPRELSMDLSDIDVPFHPRTSAVFVEVLSEYSSLLSNDSYFSPLLHRSMYSALGSVGLDMALLPLTSMAICCGSSRKHSPDNMFFRRAMDAARQKLIQEFVSVDIPRTAIVC